MLSIIVFLLNIFMLHPLHLSVCNVKITETGKNNELAVKIFIDDFSTAVYGKTGVKLSFKAEKATDDEIKNASAYIFDNLSIYNADTKVPIKNFKFKKKKIEELAVWWFFEFDLKEIPETIKIENKLMMNLFADQKNITFLVFKEKEFAELLDLNKTKITLNLLN